jgi:hypothetical protein
MKLKERLANNLYPSNKEVGFHAMNATKQYAFAEGWDAVIKWVAENAETRQEGGSTYEAYNVIDTDSILKGIDIGEDD